jgi:hypothetical protein
MTNTTTTTTTTTTEAPANVGADHVIAWHTAQPIGTLGQVVQIGRQFADGRIATTVYSPWVVVGIPGCSDLPGYGTYGEARDAAVALATRNQAR